MPRFRLKRESGNFHEWSDDEDQHGDGTGTVASKVSSLIHQAPPAHVALSGLASVKRFAFTLGLGGTRRTGRVHCGNVCIQADKAYVPKEKHPVLESHKDNQDDSGKGSQDCQSKQFMRSPTLAHYFSRLGTVTLRRENQEFVGFDLQDRLSSSCSDGRTDAAENADKPTKAGSRLLLAFLIGLLIYLFIII
uniref:Uncharacterized protein n=1 Tax=Dunaliella tertiolecta TaxID=3047 RepID=A0A7S3QWZ2_DUNTE|mmetsp:Transcript_23263/g.64288  ORF Transcript_23263/g.64288 Transcript_23263/m.64288 type:complete len:192 (+) Transcript_23263:30-605(+)